MQKNQITNRRFCSDFWKQLMVKLCFLNLFAHHYCLKYLSGNTLFSLLWVWVFSPSSCLFSTNSPFHCRVISMMNFMVPCKVNVAYQFCILVFYSARCLVSSGRRGQLSQKSWFKFWSTHFHQHSALRQYLPST